MLAIQYSSAVKMDRRLGKPRNLLKPNHDPVRRHIHFQQNSGSWVWRSWNLKTPPNKMKERSGMPYDVVAFDTDERAKLFSLEEEGAFHRLLRHAWINGSIPDDLLRLSRICRCGSVKKMEKLWLALEPLWPIDTMCAGRRINAKQESEREYKHEKSGKSRESAVKRWEVNRNAKAVSEPSPHVPISHCDGNAPYPSLPHPTLSQEEGNLNPLAILSPVEPKYSDQFLGFWNLSTKRGSKLEAFLEFKKLRIGNPDVPDPVLLQSILAGMEAWKQSEQWQDETKQPHICRWLKRRGWEEIVPRAGFIKHTHTEKCKEGYCESE